MLTCILVPEMTQTHMVLFKKWLWTRVMIMKSIGGLEVAEKGMGSLVHR